MGEIFAACQYSSVFVVHQLRPRASTVVLRVRGSKSEEPGKFSPVIVAQQKHRGISIFQSEGFQARRPGTGGGGDGGGEGLIQGEYPLTSATNIDNSVACTEKPAKSFRRLKAQKVRVLVQKFARIKQDLNQYDGPIPEDAPINISNSSFAEPEVLEVQNRSYVSGYGRVPEESHLRKTRGIKHHLRTREGKDHPKPAAAPGIERPLKYQSIPTHLEFERDRSFPIASASFKGWGRGESTTNFQHTSIDNSKQRRKLSADNSFFSRKSFRELGCNDNMVESLKAQHIRRPSCIQALAFASVIRGKSCMIADQSGSGKTLAYLVPIIQRLRQEEVEGLSKSFPQSPQVVVLVPTAELARQVLGNCRLISKLGVPFRSMVATGGFRQRTQLEALQQNSDVLIATPGRFMFLIREGLLLITNLKCVVFDEVDILLSDEEYEPALKSLIESSSITTQYLFVTATLPTDIYNKLVEVFPDCEVIMGPGMHRTSPALEEILVDCSGDDRTEKNPETAFLNKKTALLQLMEESPVAKTIVFCNKIETCRKVENVLNRYDRKGIHTRVLPFHAALAQESQLANIEEFCKGQTGDSSLILVCTDRASRGIDFTGVDRVVLFDFPRDPSEYIRRVGRTARGAGGKGKAFIFVVGKQVSLAQRIIERNRKGHPLHDVPSTYV